DNKNDKSSSKSNNNANKITRFISLAQEGSRDRWFYAFGIIPQQKNDPQLDVSKAEFVENPFHTKLEVENNNKRSFNEIGKSTSASTIPTKTQN
ncbi:unnamed protein product, partial [Rotaria sordida]